MLRLAVAVLALVVAGSPLSVLAADPDCGTATLLKSVKVKLEVCLDPAVWQKADTASGQEVSYISKDQKSAFALVTEAPVVAMADFHDAILAIAAQQAGAAAGSVKSFDDADPVLNGRNWHVMHYDVAVGAATLEFLNYFLSADGIGSAQFVFWSAPENAAATSDLASRLMATVTATP